MSLIGDGWAQGWRLDPLLLFGQLCTSGVALAFALEVFNLRRATVKNYVSAFPCLLTVCCSYSRSELLPFVYLDAALRHHESPRTLLVVTIVVLRLTVAATLSSQLMQDSCAHVVALLGD